MQINYRYVLAVLCFSSRVAWLVIYEYVGANLFENLEEDCNTESYSSQV